MLQEEVMKERGGDTGDSNVSNLLVVGECITRTGVRSQVFIARNIFTKQMA